MKIYKISVKDFHAFKEECVIDLKDGHSLLLYGENGSGKSSLYQALNLFFAPATPFGDHKNIFVTTDDGFVKLEIGDEPGISKTYEWEATTHPFTETLVAETSKTKGFLDYRSLLETHFVHQRVDSVNVFDLIVNNLLANIETPIGPSTIKNDWETIRSSSAGRRNKRHDDTVNFLISDFNANLITLLANLASKSNEILNRFEQNVSISLALPPPGIAYDSAAKKITNQTISLTATYYGRVIADHHHFLNEARLSAIAISIYLAALQLNPRSELKVLFLDDVLIGLDMSNRLPLLGILGQFFTDWQVILATYDRVWFDMVWQRVMHSGAWERGELYCCQDNECDVPIYKGNTEYLVVAKQHLDRGDLKAAAIYIRSEYERVIKKFCDEHHLPVRYCENPKEQSSEFFWQATKQLVRDKKLKDGSPILTEEVIRNIELFRATVLNQLSHSAPVSLVRTEVEQAHLAVKILQDTLRQIKPSDLQ